MNVEMFLKTLPYMAKGLLGIFAVTAIIIFCIWILNRITRVDPDKNKNNNEQR